MPLPAPKIGLSPETDRALEELLYSARAVGFSNALAKVTNLLVKNAHLEKGRDIFTILAKGIDEISKEGPSDA